MEKTFTQTIETKGRIQISSTQTISAKAKIQTPSQRIFGGNWQRKCWFDSVNNNHWRSRYDRTNDRIIFEWIANDNLGADNW